MAKLELTDVSNILGNPTSAANTINSNNSLIEAAIEKTLTRDGTTPNQLSADLDMNNNDLLNVDEISVQSITYQGETVLPQELVISDAMLGAVYDPLGVAGNIFDRFYQGDFDTEAEFVSANIPSVAMYVTTAGYLSVGDKGGHTKKRVSTPGVVQPWHKQSADGAWWEIAPEGNISANSFGFHQSRTGAQNTTALQAAIDFARQQIETILINKYIITTGDVLIAPGEYNVTGTVNMYTGVRVIGSGQSNTLLIHDGGAQHVFTFTSVSGENLYNTWVMDLAIKGAGKTSTDTISVVSAKTTSLAGMAIYGCGITRCLITNCYQGVDLLNSWTFEVSECEMYDIGRNFIRGQNITSAQIRHNRLDTCGEDGIFLTYDTVTGYETIALHIESNIIQSCQRRAIYGLDCDHVMWDQNYIENNNRAGGYPAIEFHSVSGSNSEMFSFTGGWFSPSSQTGQPAIKITAARFVSAQGIYFRGSAFTYGFELGASVDGYAIFCEANTLNGLVSVSGDTLGIAVSRGSMDLHKVRSLVQNLSQTGSSVSSSTSVLIREINCTSGGRTFTLLNSHLQLGRRFTVQKVDGGANNLVIAPEGTTKINGVNASVNSSAAYARAEIYCGYEAGTTTLCWYVKFS